MATRTGRTPSALAANLGLTVDAGTLHVALLAIGVKLALFAYGWLAYVLVPQETRVTPTDPHVTAIWLRIWSQWDVGGYLGIAERGYLPNDPGTSVWFPLFPLLMRLGAMLTGKNTFLVGLVVSNVAMVVAVVLLYRLTVLRFKDPATATRAAFYVLIFPAAFYTSTAYSEALFLAFSVASFYAMERRRWIWAGVAGGLVAATRVVGVAIAAPLALGYVLAARDRGRPVDVGALAVPLVLAGLGGVILLFGQQTGDPLAFVHGQAGMFQHSLTSPLVTLRQGWEVLNWQHLVKGFEENYATNALNLGAGVLFLVLGLASFRALGAAYGTYVLTLLLIPLSFTPLGDRPLVSMLRFTLVMFPGFMVLAHWGRKPLVDRLITVVFLLFLGLLTGLFVRSWNVAGVS